MSNYPIQFVVDNELPSNIIYLNQCSHQQLIQAATNQLSPQQIANNTFVIKDTDDATISDDEDLMDTFDNHFDIRENDQTPLSLKILLQPKQTQIATTITHSQSVSNTTEFTTTVIAHLQETKQNDNQFTEHRDSQQESKEAAKEISSTNTQSNMPTFKIHRKQVFEAKEIDNDSMDDLKVFY